MSASNNTSTMLLFESACAELSTNPQVATQKILEFREIPNAFSVSMFILQSSDNPVVQFHALSVLQHCFLKQWDMLQQVDKENLKGTLWQILLSNSVDSFVSNKAVQVFALVWKRGWCSSSATERDAVFTSISSSVQNSTLGLSKAGILVCCIVEEFAGKSSVDIGAPIQFHRDAKAAFETSGLDESFNLGVQLLSNSFISESGNINETALIASGDAVASVSKLINEVINWDFDGDDMNFSPSNPSLLKIYSYLKIPRKWAESVAKLLVSVFEIYHSLRSLYIQGVGEINNVAGNLEACRQLMISASSVTMPMFDSIEEKMQYGEQFASRLVMLMQQVTISVTDIHLSDNLAELRTREVEAVATILSRFFGNFQLRFISDFPSFENVIVNFGDLTFKLASSLSVEAEMLMNGASKVGSCGNDGCALLDGWKGDVVGLLLDAWGQFIDDQLLLLMINSPRVLVESNAQDLSAHVKMSVRKVASDVFKELFSSVLRVTLIDSLNCLDEEEDDEIENIIVRNILDFVLGACRLGRADFGNAVNYVKDHLLNAAKEMEGLQAILSQPDQTTLTRILETLRVSVLFLSNLCVEKADGSGSQDTALIPNYILDASISNEQVMATAPQTLLELIQTLSLLLQMQLQLQSTPNCPFFSPLLSQNILEFFAEYISCYIDPDLELYATSKHGNAALKLHGAEFNDVIGLLCNACKQFYVTCPFENDLVAACSLVLKRMSEARHRRSYLVSLPCMHEIFSHVTGTGMNGDCRLNSVGLSHAWEALSCVASCEPGNPLFTQLCGTAHEKCSRLSALVQTDSNAENVREDLIRCVACLNGLAKSPIGCRKLELTAVFTYAFPLLSYCLQNYNGEDDMLMAYLTLLKDYAEGQLMNLPPLASLALYRASLGIIQLISRRLKNINNVNDEEECAFKADILCTSLEMLNHLAIKNFFDFDPLDEIESVPSTFAGKSSTIGTSDSSSPQQQQQEISNILLFGLESVVPFMTPDLLRTFHSVCDKYFTFLTYIFSSQEKALRARVIHAADSADVAAGNRKLLSELIGQLLWGAGAIDSVSARLALQGLNLLATFHAKDITNGGIGFGPGAVVVETGESIFSVGLQRLFEIIIFPSSSDYGISTDRIDACASAFATLIAMDVSRFNICAQQLISQQPQHLQDTMTECLQNLISANDVDINKFNDKKNRQLFVQNMRVFVAKIRALVTYL